MMKQLSRPRRFLFTLRFSILMIFISLFLATTLLIIAIGTQMFKRELSYSSFALMKYASSAIVQELNAGIQPAEIQGKFTSHLIEQGILQDNEAEMIAYTYYMVSTLPLVQRAFWADDDGHFVFSEKEQDGSITSSVCDCGQQPIRYYRLYRDTQGNVVKRVNATKIGIDRRNEDWYRRAKSQQQFFWTDVRLFHPQPQLGITAVTPVMKKGQFHGVFGLNITLRYLTHFVTGQRVSPHGYSFLITKDENLVAYPERAPFTRAIRYQNKLINVHAIALPLIDASIDHYKKTGRKEFRFNYQNKTYLITYENVKALDQYGWLVGVVTPQSDLISPLQKINLMTVCVSLGILVFGIIIVSNLVTRIVKPINRLVKEAERIEQFDLDSDIKVDTRLKEVLHLSEAMQAMRLGLQQFQKYIPKILVRQLLESGEEIRVGGERKPLVVMFSDIENFTSIAEKVDANALMLQVCDYFEMFSSIIMHEKGTIDKYIGDSVMAFWGAPLIEDEPCERAARSALACLKQLQILNESWLQQGKPRLVTRFGIHAGDAIVGNVGSAERLNYTALGDAINVTSRLEALNKIYKTKILVSETVYLLLKDKFVLRHIDAVALKGRTAVSAIYELLSDNKQTLSFDVDAYRATFDQGFAAYQAKNWDEALSYFRRCFSIYPEDSVAPLFIERCENFRISH